MTVIASDYAGPDDLRAMQALVQRLWTRRSHLHVGDLAWQRNPYGATPAQPTRLWRDGDQAVAWVWGQGGGAMHILVDPAFADHYDEALAWLAGASQGVALQATALETDAALIGALERNGYQRRPDAPFGLQAFRTLDDEPPVTLPAGFRALTMEQIVDVARKVAGHRAAWSRLADYDPADPPLNSSMSVERCEALMRTWPYRPELDWAIEAPDGRLAACATTWLDEANGVGLFEPVGVDPDFRRLGLSQALGAAALGGLKCAGARLAMVKPRGDNAYPVPRHAYKAMGFVVEARQYVFVRRPPEAADRRAPRPSALF